MNAAQTLDPRIFTMVDHGSSPFGLSYWSSFMECGKKGRLKEAERAKGVLPILPDAANEDAPADNDKLSMMRVGIYTHAMFEFIYNAGVAANDVIWPETLAGDVNFREAVRLFLAYAQNWGSIEERWGCKIVAVELPLGEADPDAVKSILGGPFTGRADAIIEIVDPARARENTGHILMPGRYILDYKTSKARGSTDADKFSSRNLQASGYLWLDALERGEGGALGVIFERMYLHKIITRDKSYDSYVAWPQTDTQERLRAMVTLGALGRHHGLPNPSACVNFFGEQCYFQKSGACPGY